MKKSNNKRKVFILDTSVLLYDKESIYSFPENDVILPLLALDELDRHKDKKGVVGENARFINRYLDDLRTKGNLHTGVKIDHDQTIKEEIKGNHPVPVGLDASLPDNQMIALALNMTQNLNCPVIMVTKDINFRVKCDALGICSQDYLKDKVQLNENEFYKGYSDISCDDSLMINKLYEEDHERLDSIALKFITNQLGRELYQNEFFCLKSHDKQSFLGYRSGDRIIRVKNSKNMSNAVVSVKERNREQLYALNLLFDPEIPLVSITGLAGSGKTYLTLMAAIEGLHSGQYQRLVITRNLQPVGREMGFLPGDINDKMMPWISPILDNFRQGLKDNDLSYFNNMREKGAIEIAPLAFMRGRTFNDTFLIMDEAQNATIHELKTVITRIGENSKIVLLGDVDQIDTPYIDSYSNGLTIVGEKFKNELVAGHVQLKKGERSYLSSIAAKII